MSGEQKLKDGDEITQTMESTNNRELLFFTNRCQVYKAKIADFDDTKASVLGDFIPAKLGMEEGENVIYMAVTKDYSGFMLFFFENGKVAKVELSAYETKTNRKKLVKAYSNKSLLAAARFAAEDCELVLQSSAGRLLLLHTGAIAPQIDQGYHRCGCDDAQARPEAPACAGLPRRGVCKAPPLPHEKFARRGRASERRG